MHVIPTLALGGKVENALLLQSEDFIWGADSEKMETMVKTYKQFLQIVVHQ
jgi:hypothetical protein